MEAVPPAPAPDTTPASKKRFKNPISKRLSSLRDKRKHQRALQQQQQQQEEQQEQTSPPPSTEPPIPMDEALEECKLAIDLFLNNKFEDAKNVVEPL